LNICKFCIKFVLVDLFGTDTAGNRLVDFLADLVLVAESVPVVPVSIGRCNMGFKVRKLGTYMTSSTLSGVRPS
jgi:hypothetical protein